MPTNPIAPQAINAGDINSPANLERRAKQEQIRTITTNLITLAIGAGIGYLIFQNRKFGARNGAIAGGVTLLTLRMIATGISLFNQAPPLKERLGLAPHNYGGMVGDRPTTQAATSPVKLS